MKDHCHHTGCYRDAAHCIDTLKHSRPKWITIIFQDGSTYDYNFIIKELAKEFEMQFTFLGENTEKYITFAVPIEKEVLKIGKNGELIPKTISYRLKFIDNAKFMTSSL